MPNRPFKTFVACKNPRSSSFSILKFDKKFMNFPPETAISFNSRSVSKRVKQLNGHKSAFNSHRNVTRQRTRWNEGVLWARLGVLNL